VNFEDYCGEGYNRAGPISCWPSFFYPSWLDDNLSGNFEPRVDPGNGVIDEFVEAEVKYNKLCKRV